MFWSGGNPFAAITLLITLCISCGTSKDMSRQDPASHNEDFIFVDDKVLVLFIELEDRNANLRGAKIISGSFKPLAEHLSQRESVRIQYLDDQYRVLFEKVLDNPLIQYKEYDDDEGKIHRIRIEGQKGSILLRSQHSESVKLIRVEYGENDTYKTVATLPLVLSS